MVLLYNSLNKKYKCTLYFGNKQVNGIRHIGIVYTLTINKCKQSNTYRVTLYFGNK